MKRSLAFLLALFLIPFLASANVSAAPSTAASPVEGTLWVFTVGVSEYRNPSIRLAYADNDAESLARSFETRSSTVFREVKTRVLVNEAATRQSIMKEMRAFFAKAGPEDVAIIALMGHGVVDGGTYYFLPYPADLTNLAREGLTLAEFETGVKEVGNRLQRVLLAIDTCHAGRINLANRTRGLMPAAPAGGGGARGVGLAGGMVAPRSIKAYVLSSSTEAQESLEDSNYRLPGETKGHGVFTYALLDGMRGRATTDPDGTINVLDIFSYADRQVRKLTGSRQTPSIQVPEQATNFALARGLTRVPPEQAKKAEVLVQAGRDEEQRGEYDKAASSYAEAEKVNPRDERVQLLADRAKEEKAYRADPQKQQEVAVQAQKLVAEAKQPPTPAPENPWAQPKPMVVTFLDFKTQGGGNEKAGLDAVLVQRVGQALEGTKRVKVVERRLLDKVLEEQKLSASDMADPATKLKVGRILVARLIATGEIVFLSPTHLALNVRMIDTETTEVKINLSKDATDLEQVVGMADEVATEIADQVRREYPIRGEVISQEGAEIVLNVGGKHGVTPGMAMKAIVEEPIVVNGEVVANKKKEIGTLEVTAAEEKASFARATEAKAPFGKGTKVLEPMPTPTPAPTAIPAPTAMQTPVPAPSPAVGGPAPGEAP